MLYVYPKMSYRMRNVTTNHIKPYYHVRVANLETHPPGVICMIELWGAFNHQPHPTLEGYLQGETPLSFCFHNVFSRRCEHPMHYQTQAQHCAIRHVHFFFVFLPAISSIVSGPAGQLPGSKVPRWRSKNMNFKI